MTMKKFTRDEASLALVFGAAIAGESLLWAAGFIVAALLLQSDRIEAEIRRYIRRQRR